MVTTGGTGISPTDATPDQTRAVLDYEVPGIAEAIRAHGAALGVPTAALSRGLAGVARTTLVVNLPGSSGGRPRRPGRARAGAAARGRPDPWRRPRRSTRRCVLTPGWPAHLSHGRIGLRPISARDASAWREIRTRNRSWLSPWEATLPPGTQHQPQSFRVTARDLRRQARAGRGLPFVTTYDGRMVGQVTVSSVTWGSARSASVGYWVDRAYAGRGITPTAVALVIDHCFATVGLHRIEIAVRPENTASLAVVAKLGLRREGEAPRYLHIDGDWRDHVLFAITREEVPQGILARALASHQSQD